MRTRPTQPTSRLSWRLMATAADACAARALKFLCSPRRTTWFVVMTSPGMMNSPTMLAAIVGVFGALLGFAAGSGYAFWATRRTELATAVGATAALGEALMDQDHPESR